MRLNRLTKNNILMSSNYLILVVYIFGVYRPLVKIQKKVIKVLLILYLKL